MDTNRRWSSENWLFDRSLEDDGRIAATTTEVHVTESKTSRRFLDVRKALIEGRVLASVCCGWARALIREAPGWGLLGARIVADGLRLLPGTPSLKVLPSFEEGTER